MGLQEKREGERNEGFLMKRAAHAKPCSSANPVSLALSSLAQLFEMEEEIRNAPAHLRPNMNKRLTNYKQELVALKRAVVRKDTDFPPQTAELCPLIWDITRSHRKTTRTAQHSWLAAAAAERCVVRRCWSG